MDYLNKSRIEEVLIAILGKGMVTSRLLSRIEKILDAIRVKGSYDGIAMSEIEEILVCILLGKRFEKPTHSRIAAMLKVKANGGEYTELRKSRVEELIFEWINAVESATYTGTLPATLRTVEGYLESYKIYGNTVQAGTPTPENPITPSGCGERTENLFDVVQYRANYIHGKARDDSGTEFTAEYNGYSTYMVPVVSGETYVLKGTTSKKIDTTNWLSRIYFLNSQKQFVSRSNSFTNFTTDSAYTFTIPDGITYIELQMCTELTYDDVMLVKGSTAPSSYTPYGYKLPILSNSTVTNIYLGEVATTRKIKKLVLTGEEPWNLQSINSHGISNLYTQLPKRFNSTTVGLSSHFNIQTTLIADTTTEGFLISAGGNVGVLYIRIYATRARTVEDFKSYLAAQYAAGTPVITWYVLAEPETAVVNEPLMKIGNYADTVSMEQAGVSIPTVAGTTVIDYDGEPKPDKVELTYSKPK